MKLKVDWYFVMASRQRRYKGKRSFLFLALSTLIVLVGGMLTLLMGQQENSRADAGYVVGPPTLPAATVNQIFARVGSPMAGTGAIVEQAARRANIDDAFALGVWWTETNDGAAGVGLADRNPGSVRGNAGYPAAFDGYTIYPSYTTAINDWFTLLRNRYVNQGLTSAYTICYPYVGTSGAASWAGKVVNLMLRYHGEAPVPVTSTPIAGAPNPAPAAPITIATAVVHKSIPTASARVPDSKKRARIIMEEQHRPVNVGQGRVQNLIQGSGHRALGVARPLSASARTNGIFTTHVQQILIVLVLLAATLVILPSIRLKWRERGEKGMRRREMILASGSVKRTTTEGLHAGSFLPLYVNEYSPIGLGREEGVMRETGALARDMVSVGVPATPLLGGMGTVPLTPFVAETGAGHGRRGEMTLRRARLVPVGFGETATEGMESVTDRSGRRDKQAGSRVQ